MSIIQAMYKTGVRTKTPDLFYRTNQRTSDCVVRDEIVRDWSGKTLEWQGRWDLHRWLEQYFESYGGKDDEYANDSRACSFNGASLEINLAILNDWQITCNIHKKIPIYLDEEHQYLDYDLEAISIMRTLIAKGWYIYYWATY